MFVFFSTIGPVWIKISLTEVPCCLSMSSFWAGSFQITVLDGTSIHFTLVSTFQFQNFWYKCCSFLGMTVASFYQCSPVCHCQKGSMGLFLGKQFQLSSPALWFHSILSPPDTQFLIHLSQPNSCRLLKRFLPFPLHISLHFFTNTLLTVTAYPQWCVSDPSSWLYWMYYEGEWSLKLTVVSA